MASTTSGTTTFDLDVNEIIEQALEPLGGEHQSGIESAKARRTLNLVLIQLQNKNIPLSKLDFIDEALTVDVATLSLDNDVVDVLECSLLKDGEDVAIPLTRKGLREYQLIPSKDTSARPNLYTVERGASNLTLTFWPVPNAATYTAKLLVVKRIEDITASYQKVNLPYRYLPLLIKWLSYELSLHRQGIGEEVRTRLKNEVLEAMPDVFDADLERVDFVVTPGGISGR